MRLSMSMIYNYLSGYRRESHLQSDSMTIKGVRFLAGSKSEYSADYVYIGNASDYFQDPVFSDALILSSGRNHILCSGADHEDLLNDALSAFDYYNEAERVLFEAAATRSPAASMLSAIAELLPDPFFIFDLEGRLLGCTHGDVDTGDELAEACKKSGCLGTATLGNDFEDMEGNSSHDLEDFPKVTRIRGKQTKCIAMYITQGQERVGFVMCFPKDEDARISAALCLEPLICGFLAQAGEFTDSSSLHLSKTVALKQMLLGDGLSDEAFERFRAQCDISGHCCLIEMQTLGIQNYTLRTMLINELESSGTVSASCQLDDKVIVLTEESRTAGILRQVFTKIPQSNIKIGISLPMPELSANDVEYNKMMAEYAFRGNAEGFKDMLSRSTYNRLDTIAGFARQANNG